MSIGTLIVIWLICGGIAALIGQKKNLPVKDSFIWGALLGIIGVVVVICQRPGLPQAPPGMRAVKCPRCNTIQNVPESQRIYECWQCKASHELWAAPRAAPVAQAVRIPAGTSKVKCHACQHVQVVPFNEATFVYDPCGLRLMCKQTSNQGGS
jgi:ribosomal protein S27E